MMDNEALKPMPTDALVALLNEARGWHKATNVALGGGLFNTEVSKWLLAFHVRTLEALVEGRVTTNLPSRHHP